MKPKIMMLSADDNQKRTLHARSDNAETMILKDTDEIIKNIFNRFREGLENLWSVAVLGLIMSMDYITRVIR